MPPHSPETALLGRLAAIDNQSLDNLLKDLEGQLNRSQMALLKAELAAVAEKTFSPRFWAKKEVAA